MTCDVAASRLINVTIHWEWFISPIKMVLTEGWNTIRGYPLIWHCYKKIWHCFTHITTIFPKPFDAIRNGWNMVKHSSGRCFSFCSQSGQGASRCDGDEVVECQSPSGFLLPWVDLEDLPQIQHSSNKEWHEQHLNATEPTFQFHL